MNIRRLTCGFWVIAAGLQINLVAEEGYDEQTSRHATAMEWNHMTQRAEQSIRDWLQANHGEELISSRRYYEFWNVEHKGGRRYLLVITGLKQARGNYGSIDLVVVQSERTTQPMVFHFGDPTDRYIDKVLPKSDGIQIDYFHREQGGQQPNVPGRSVFRFAGDSLQEVVLELPDEEKRSMEIRQAQDERIEFLNEQVRRLEKKREIMSVVIGPDGKYTVKRGDTAAKIAQLVGLRIDRLFILNPGIDWAKLTVGQSLQVQEAKESSKSKP